MTNDELRQLAKDTIESYEALVADGRLIGAIPGMRPDEVKLSQGYVRLSEIVAQQRQRLGDRDDDIITLTNNVSRLRDNLEWWETEFRKMDKGIALASLGNARGDIAKLKRRLVGARDETKRLRGLIYGWFNADPAAQAELRKISDAITLDKDRGNET